MGAIAERIYRAHHERCSIQERLDAEGPIPPLFLFSSEYRKAHKAKMDDLTAAMNRACDEVVRDMQTLLVALREAVGQEGADSYIDLAGAIIDRVGYTTAVTVKTESVSLPRQLNVVDAINEAVATKETAKATSQPMRRRQRAVAQHDPE